jgi:hypothetical protein
MFTFSTKISNDIEGEWISSKELKLTFHNINSETINYKLTGVGRMKNPKRIGYLKISINKQKTFLADYNRTVSNTIFTTGEYFHIQPSIAYNQECIVDGTWGEQPRVTITSIRASDLNDPPIEGFSKNDALSFTFDVPTNMPPSSNKEEIDQWLVFGGYINNEQNIPKLYQCPLNCLYPGKKYSGKWISNQKLLITIEDGDISEKQSGTSASGAVLKYKDVPGVTPTTQIHILTKDEVKSGMQGGFAVFVKDFGGLTSIDGSSPPCRTPSRNKQFCGRIAVGDWGYIADLTSISGVMYVIALVFFFGMIMYKVAVLIFTGVV